MAWFKVDDGFWSHPKTLQLSGDAIALWLRAGTWCAEHLTDGVVSAAALAMLNSDPRAVSELVACGMWEAVGDGCRFHDWADYQPSRERVHERRRASRERIAKWRERNAVTDDVRNAVSNAAPDPTRPDPKDTHLPETPNGAEGVQGEAPRKRGRRIPEPFIVTAHMRQWAATEAPGVDVDATTRQFVDYWRAESGQRATKRDWTAAWHYWLRRDTSRPRAPAQTPTQRALATAQAGARVQAEIDATTRKAIA